MLTATGIRPLKQFRGFFGQKAAGVRMTCLVMLSINGRWPNPQPLALLTVGRTSKQAFTNKMSDQKTLITS